MNQDDFLASILGSKKVLPEDCVQFRIYCHNDGTTKNLQLFGHAKKACILNHVQEQYTRHYLWQRDPFSIQRVKAVSKTCCELHGKTRFAENIEDEWFIVFLLFDISNNFPDTIIQVSDNDGEFLLIEAAMDVPSWISPENCANRVFIYQGKLHLVPKTTITNPAQIPASIQQNDSDNEDDEENLPPIDLQTAIGIVKGHDIMTEANAKIQQAIQRRIQVYPAKINKWQHKARCLLPRSVASALHKTPQLISNAVRAFYHRDPTMMKQASKMERFSPNVEPQVMTMVTFTRCLYSMLDQQEFGAPKVFPKLPAASHPDFGAANLGCKIACGFEMAYHNSEAKAKSTPPDTQQNASDFVLYLKQAGFVANTEQDYMDAAHKYLHIQPPLSFKEQIDTITSNEYNDIITPDDSLAWTRNMEDLKDVLDIKADQNDASTSKKQQEDAPTERTDAQRAKKAQDIIAGMKGFLNAQSSHQGVEIDPNELDTLLQRAFQGLSVDDLESSETQDADQDILAAMQEMDQELQQHLNDDLFEQSRERDDDYVVLKNVLESYKAQDGMSGPFSNLLGQMGVPLPDELDMSSEEEDDDE